MPREKWGIFMRGPLEWAAMEINPYEPSASATPVDQRASESDGISASDEQFLRYAQLLVRLMGVMFVIDGTATLTFCVTHALHSAYAMQPLGGEFSINDSYVAGWFVSGPVTILAGVYLALGGRWILEKVVLPARIGRQRANFD